MPILLGDAENWGRRSYQNQRNRNPAKWASVLAAMPDTHSPEHWRMLAALTRKAAATMKNTETRETLEWVASIYEQLATRSDQS